MFEHAKTLLLGGRFVEAAALFDRVVSLEPKGSFTPASLFNAGLCYFDLEDRPKALTRFRDLATHFPDAAETHPALIRIMRLQAYDDAWPELASTAQLVLSRTDSAPIESIEAHGCRALAAVEQNDIETAATQISKARTIIEDQHLDTGGQLPIGAAHVFFALGELRRLKANRIQFAPMPPDFARVLEERCQMLLEAQDAFLQSMRTYDAHWAAMSGYRVGQLYQKLHDDLLAIAPPANTQTAAHRQLFEGALRRRSRVLLKTALGMMDRTVTMGERTGEHSVWVTRAREARNDIERAIGQEREALAKLPWSETDLQQALDDLAARKHGP